MEKAYLLPVVQPAQGVGEVHHVRAAGSEPLEAVQFFIRKSPPWFISESPCPDEIASCHAALLRRAFDQRKLLFRDPGDHRLVPSCGGLLPPGFLIFQYGGIFVFHI